MIDIIAWVITVIIYILAFYYVCRFFYWIWGLVKKGPQISAVTTRGIDGMTGVEFESWCVKLLAGLGARNITTTKRTGDQGVDIIAEYNGLRYAIQCKCYSKPIGNKPVQEVYAGMQYYHCVAGAVMTNQTFTSGGKALAKSTGVELWDRQWLESASKRTSVKIEEPKAKRARQHTPIAMEERRKWKTGNGPINMQRKLTLIISGHLCGNHILTLT